MGPMMHVDFFHKFIGAAPEDLAAEELGGRIIGTDGRGTELLAQCRLMVATMLLFHFLILSAMLHTCSRFAKAEGFFHCRP